MEASKKDYLIGLNNLYKQRLRANNTEKDLNLWGRVFEKLTEFGNYVIANYESFSEPEIDETLVLYKTANLIHDPHSDMKDKESKVKILDELLDQKFDFFKRSIPYDPKQIETVISSLNLVRTRTPEGKSAGTATQEVQPSVQTIPVENQIIDFSGPTKMIIRKNLDTLNMNLTYFGNEFIMVKKDLETLPYVKGAQNRQDKITRIRELAEYYASIYSYYVMINEVYASMKSDYEQLIDKGEPQVIQLLETASRIMQSIVASLFSSLRVRKISAMIEQRKNIVEQMAMFNDVTKSINSAINKPGKAFK